MMTAEEAIKVLRDIKLGIFIDTYFDEAVSVSKENEALEIAIKALEQQPCEDCISREAVDEYITHLLSGYLYDEERTRLEELTTYIWELPSVTPKAEQKWIPVSERPEDGTWNIFTDGKTISVERYKSDAIDHFYPQGRWFDFEDAIAWMPLPQPYKAESEVEDER